jgi:hypothetical protein
LRTLICISLITLATLEDSSVRAIPQSAGGVLPSIEEMMSAKEFDAAGLRKLSADELHALNVWLRTYTQGVAKAATATAATANGVPTTTEIIESQIDGEFEGWDGETIFKLRNGQIWQQSSYAYTYHYAYAPKVVIYKSGSAFKMKVDGVSGEIAVKRLK